jgi:hypothetical protein
MSIRTIGRHQYLIGRSSRTGLYTIWQKEHGHLKERFSSGDFKVFKAGIKRITDTETRPHQTAVNGARSPQGII